MTDLSEAAGAMIGQALPEITYEYNERDVSLYALGVGAPAGVTDQDELRFVYELSGSGFRVLPTFPAVFPNAMIRELIKGELPGGVKFNPMMLVHGEQRLELKAELPPAAVITCKPVISAVYDKGSGMVIVLDVPCYDASGREIVMNQSSMFIRGLGGYGGDRGPASAAISPPDRAPDAVATEQTLPQQALIYRLSGDINPLHADPMMAALGGFDRPILHGLSTFGFAGRAVLKHFCENNPARFRSIKARFAGHVFPGETLVTEMWREAQGVLFQTSVAERGTVVLSHALVTVA
ncbi:MAG: MaoC like domain protein [Chloroflexi bacterium OLB15]|nr:MAG: MaoC like domain protein [Chloroflexi bacterium OLB15]